MAQIWESRNYQITSYFFTTVIMAAMLQFKTIIQV